MKETMPSETRHEELLNRLMDLARMGVEAVLREDWPRFEAVIGEREKLAASIIPSIPEQLLSCIREADRRTIQELYRKRSEARAALEDFRRSKCLDPWGAARGRRARGFEIKA